MQFPAVMILLLAATTPAAGYSVLAHEAIIDIEWDNGIKPLLKARFPNATENDLRQAH